MIWLLVSWFFSLCLQEKTDYIVLIEKLGGKVYDTMFFSTSCTHLIVGKPSRSEKYLGALASGKWLLRKSFLEASRQAGHFVEVGSLVRCWFLHMDSTL